MKIDIHCHTSKYSTCSRQTPEEMVEKAIKRGLDGLVITEHSRLWSENELDELQKRYPALLILTGLELSSKGYDILVYGLPSDFPVPEGLIKTSGAFWKGGKSSADHISVEWVLDYLRLYACAFILPHPFRYSETMNIPDKILKKFQAIEIASSNFNTEETEEAFYLAGRLDVPTTVASDSHSTDSVGLWYIETPEMKNISDFVSILKNKKWTGSNIKIEFQKDEENKKKFKKAFKRTLYTYPPLLEEDSSGIKDLIHKLEDSDKTIRQKAVKELGNSMNRSAVDALIKALYDRDIMVRWASLEGLGRLRDKRAISYIMKAFEEKNSGTREYAVKALGEIGRLEAVDFLIKDGLKDTSHHVRLKTVEALLTLGDPEAIKPLKETLNRESPLSFKMRKELGRVIKELEKNIIEI